MECTALLVLFKLARPTLAPLRSDCALLLSSIPPSFFAAIPAGRAVHVVLRPCSPLPRRTRVIGHSRCSLGSLRFGAPLEGAQDCKC